MHPEQPQHDIIVSLAANCDHEQNLAEARTRLSPILSSFAYTRQLFTSPVGGGSGQYLNQLLYARTPLDEPRLCDALKQIELQMGRTPADRQLGIVRIDLDLLAFDAQRRHEADWQRPYVQQLLRR